MIRSAYIHIPFCKTRCPYCDFAVWVDPMGNLFEPYVLALCKEILLRSSKEVIGTIYIGGGTPSILPIQLLKRLFETLHSSFHILPTAEITLEVNPGTVDQNKLLEFKQLGINRLSVGVQTFDETLLRKLARGHTVKDALELIQAAHEVGFQNISLDLIYGLPKQNLNSWQETLNIAFRLPIQHISCYSLTIEENTPFKKIYGDSSHSELPIEDDLVLMYEALQNTLQDNCFIQYEVSNFSRPNFESKHNLTYWRNEEFYGFGVSAHEFKDGKRKAHLRDLKAYINNPIEQTELDCDPALEEIMLRLRLKEGIDLDVYQKKFGINVKENRGDLLKDFAEKGLINLRGNQLSLTEKGFLLSTHLIARLI